MHIVSWGTVLRREQWHGMCDPVQECGLQTESQHGQSTTSNMPYSLFLMPTHINTSYHSNNTNNYSSSLFFISLIYFNFGLGSLFPPRNIVRKSTEIDPSNFALLIFTPEITDLIIRVNLPPNNKRLTCSHERIFTSRKITKKRKECLDVLQRTISHLSHRNARALRTYVTFFLKLRCVFFSVLLHQPIHY